MKVFFYGCQTVWVLSKTVVTYAILDASLPEKQRTVVQRIIQGILAAILIFFDVANIPLTGVVYSSGVLIVSALLFAAIGCMFLYRCSWLKCFQIVYCFWAALSLLDFLLQLILYMMMHDMGFDTGLFLQVGYARGIYLLITAAVLFAMRRKMKALFRDYLCRTRMVRAPGLFISALLWLMIMYFMQIYHNKLAEFYVQMWWLFALVCIVLAVVFFIHGSLRNAREEVRLQQVQIEALEQNYAEIRKAYEMRRVMVHDMKNHMLMLREMAKEQDYEKIVAYIDSMYAELHGKGTESWFRCAVVDTVLRVKKKSAEEEKITFEIESDSLDKIELNDLELCAIFSNLLDNALEANRKGAAEAKKWIRLQCRRRGDMLVINMENALFEKVQMVNGLPKTTKKEKESHGLGLLSIRRVVEQHGGWMKMEGKEGEFHTDLYLKAFGIQSEGQKKAIGGQ